MINIHRPLTKLIAEQEEIGDVINSKISQFNKLNKKKRTHAMKTEMLDLMEQYDDLNDQISSHPLSCFLECETSRVPVGISIN